MPFRPPGARMIRDPGDIRLGDVVGKCGSGCLCISGIPWDWSTAGRPGARYAPPRIREHLYSFNIHIRDLCICDAGDVDIAPGDIALSSKRIYEAVGELLTKCRGIVLLGGDHSITRHAVSSAVDTLGGTGGLLVLDAHLDLRRLSEGLSSGTYLRELLEERGERIRVAVVGVRRHSVPGYMLELADRMGVRYLTADRLSTADASRFLGEVFSGVDWIYISFDSDVLDPHQCPGVNSPSPFGITLREAVGLIEEASKLGRVVGLDIVEYVPLLDVGDICGRNLAYIAYRALEVLASRP